MDNCFTLIYRTMSTLSNKKIAILSESGFEESELTSPKAALEEAGATVHIISPQKDSIKSWDKDNWGIELKVDKAVSEASVEDYDGLLIPGGVMNPDKLRNDQSAVAFTKSLLASGTQIDAICQLLHILIETDLLRGNTLT